MEEKKQKDRLTSATVEIETIKEEKSINYKRNRTILIVFSILSLLLLIYIIYLCVCAFLPIEA